MRPRQNCLSTQYTQKYERAFFQDLDALGCERPEIIARATENIEQMVDLIERLAAKDLAYQAPDGSWYFRIAGFPEYGKLSKKDFTAISDGARVDLDEYDKDSARDFALWKAAKPGEHWDTRLGPAGRAGTLSVPRWRSSTWARPSTCTPGART